MIRTIAWKWQENEGRIHKFLVPKSFYAKEGNVQLLSPQHWCKRRKIQNQYKRLKGPLLWGHGMVCLPEASGGMGVSPFSIGMVCNIKGGSQDNIVCHHSGSILEVVGSDRGLGVELQPVSPKGQTAKLPQNDRGHQSE
jgi:hypothetical protein